MAKYKPPTYLEGLPQQQQQFKAQILQEMGELVRSLKQFIILDKEMEEVKKELVSRADFNI